MNCDWTDVVKGLLHACTVSPIDGGCQWVNYCFDGQQMMQ